MDKIKIPLYEDLFFVDQFKKYLLHQINSMYLEYKEVPDEVSLKGKLGRHLYNIITSNNWNFNKTKIIHERGPNVMEIRFTRNITISKESNQNVVKNESLDGKIVDGIVDSSMVSNFGKSSMGFNIEKTVTPSKTILIEELK